MSWREGGGNKEADFFGGPSYLSLFLWESSPPRWVVLSETGTKVLLNETVWWRAMPARQLSSLGMPSVSLHTLGWVACADFQPGSSFLIVLNACLNFAAGSAKGWVPPCAGG